jgi:hypothetical protein
MAQIPTPDLAVPYAAPKQVNTIAAVHPIAPKNGYTIVSSTILMARCCRDLHDDGIMLSKVGDTNRVNRAEKLHS